MNTWLYDGTFRGYLTVICTLMEAGWPEAAIDKNTQDQPGLFNTEQVILAADPVKYEAMAELIKKKISRESLNIARSAFLSEAPNIEQALYTFVRMGLEKGPEIIHRLDHDHIIKVLKASRRTFFEANKYKGIIRFTDCGDGVKYACMEPDTNVLPIVAAHFKARFPADKWILHDTKRGLALLYDTGSLELIKRDALEGTPVAAAGQGAASDRVGGTEAVECDDPYALLWIKYFRIMGIESRKNSRLQKQFLPLKRRKYVLEFDV